MQPAEFLDHARSEQEKWINPVGRLILAAASVERSVNEILEFLSPEDIEIWRLEEFSERVDRLSIFAKENLTDSLVAALRNQKRKYWPIMEYRNAIAHNPLFFAALEAGGAIGFRAAIHHQRKNVQYELADVQRFADEADEAASELMKFAIDFPKAVDEETRYVRVLMTGMHLTVGE